MSSRSPAPGSTLLGRCLSHARRIGMLEDAFARQVLEVSPTTLWRIKSGKRPMRPVEMTRLRRWSNGGGYGQ